jgi:branched-chain amino acid transport system permease protein
MSGHENPSWRGAVRGGLIWGGAAVFVAVAGMVEAFAGRELIQGFVSLGMTLVLMLVLGAGYQAGRRRPGEGLLGAVLRGVVAGGVAGAVLAAFVVLGMQVNLRSMLINASPALFNALTLGHGTGGVPLLVLVTASAGAAGAAGALLGGRLRRPVVAGLLAVLAAGLFQDLLQLLLAEGSVRPALRQYLYGTGGLLVHGAVTVFLVAAGITAVAPGRRPAVQRRIEAMPERSRRILRMAFAALGILVLLLIPQAAGPFLSQVLVLVGLYALMGLGLNLEVGFAGLLDLGFVAFFAIGAYTVGLLTTVGGELGFLQVSFWQALPVAVAVSLAAGVILGLPVLGIRGDYLAIATLGFGEIVRLLVLSDFLRPWLGGSQGVLSIPSPVIMGFEFLGPQLVFYLTVVSSIFVAFVAGRLRDSRLGRAWMALREDEDVAQAMGINLINVKLLAYGLGAAFAGVSGGIFAIMVGSVFPHSFQLLISINVLALIIVGGMGSTPGVVVGALFLVGMPELLREFADFRFLVYGAVLVMMMQLRPEGLWPAASIRRELHAAAEEAPAPLPAEMPAAKEPARG